MSIDFGEVKSAIQARMAEQWTATPLDAIAWENAAFNPQSDGGAWLRIYVVERGSSAPVAWTVPESAAARLAGVIYVMGFVPVGSGDAALEQMLTAAKALFEGQSFDGASSRIQVQESSSPVAGLDGPWYRKMIALRFFASAM